MDNKAQDFARRLVGLLEDIRNLLTHQAPPRQECRKSNDEKQDTKEKDGTTDAHVTATPKPTPPIKHAAESDDHWYKRFPWWKCWEGLGILSVIAYAVITYWLWSDANTNFKTDQRAWVGFTHLEIPQDMGIGSFRAVLTMENRGKTPAIRATVKYGEFAPYCLATLPSDPFILTKLPKTVEVSLLPNLPQQTGVMSIQIDKEVFHALTQEPGCRLYIVGNVEYFDIFRKAHFRRFCAYWNNTTTRAFDACDTYTDGDEDYPKGAK
jgi:hypothetical protein